MLDEKIQSAKDAKIDEKFYPTQMLYPSSKTNQYMLNLGKHVLFWDTKIEEAILN